nr:helitron helicase-like domain-containing protein [Tanacetum cinerariifolium]
MSFGAKIDESINVDRGPYVFKVFGQIYHLIDLPLYTIIMPAMGEALRFLQLYIYDTDNKVENKMRHFSGIHNIDLDSHIVEGLIHFLDAYNELVQLFRTARDKCRELEIPEFKIRLYNGQGECDGYEVRGRIILPMSFTGGLRYIRFNLSLPFLRKNVYSKMSQECSTQSSFKSEDCHIATLCFRPMGESSTKAAPSREMVDEIQNYVEGRFICAHEAYWRILKFDIHHREPTVQILAVYLQDM